MIKKIVLCIVILLSCTCRLNLVQANENHAFSDLTIVINSCDKYTELWAPFFKILFHNWPELNNKYAYIPIVLISNNKRFENSRITNFNSGHETSWSDTVKRALSSCKTKYILYLQDDYFITYFNAERLQNLFEIMKRESLGYLQISYPVVTDGRQQVPNANGVYYKSQFEQWRTSLQAAFWERQLFMRLIKDGEKIWDFEISGSQRSEGSERPFATVLREMPIQYHNMLAGGVLNDSLVLDIKNMYGIVWETKLPIASKPSYKQSIKKFLDFSYVKIITPTKRCLKYLFDSLY
jgi:hypothetical protein